ncbi:hypothetical protein DL93DRAFT_2089352 [Clavulina sp. PMI_390]|nr:hypothetical protein DL93DRAFT_2089352 [Clavulina sp. PMI_390]
MSDNPDDVPQPASTLTNPKEDADRIRLKRLAKLQNTTSPSSQSSPLPSSSSSPAPAPPPQLAPTPKPIPKPSAKRPAVAEPTPPPKAPTARKPAAPAPFNLKKWEPETVSRVFNVTLDRAVAEAYRWEIVWLKELSSEILSESPTKTLPPLSAEVADRCLIARLEIDPQGGMTEDPELITVIANLPPEQTTFEYLVSCWQRIYSLRIALHKRFASAKDDPALPQADAILDQLRDLVISYAGLTLQEPTMFPQPKTTKQLGIMELAVPLLSMSGATPLGSSVSTSLQAHEVEPFIRDLAKRFDGDDLESTFGEALVNELMGVIIRDKGGLASSSLGIQSWRAGVSAMEALSAVKPLAAMIPRLPGWVNPQATGPTIELLSIIGPIARLGIFAREWPTIAEAYYSNPERRTRDEVDAANNTLRNTLQTVQGSTYHILDHIVRAGPEPREAVLNYLAKCIQLNVKRSGSHVDPATVASDSFMLNLCVALLRFAEPFLDAKLSKLDRVDPLYYARSNRLDISEETRILADAAAAKAFKEANHAGPAPNFISDIFYLASSFLHYGLVTVIHNHDNTYRRYDDLQRELERVEGDTRHQGTPMQAQVDQLIKRIKDAREKALSAVFAFQCQLLDNDLIFRGITFTTFSMAWLIRIASPGSTYPEKPPSLPLAKEVPEAFRMLPEHFIEDVIEFYLYLVRNSQQQLEAAAKNDMLVFILTFLSSPWYIKNPFLKSKLVQILFYGTLPYGRNNAPGIFVSVINTHPLALEHLMPVLMRFYVDVENTGASSQFYDKFDSRRNVAYIFKCVWNTPAHRKALSTEAHNTERFVRFANLLMNDATYLLDEALSKLSEIKSIQEEMADQTAWMARDANERGERQQHLRQTEGQATSYITLGKSTVELLKLFTAETKEPWMLPEIVDRLAAMLDFNLALLTGPRSAELNVEGRDKYRFNPRLLLSDILSVFLNLGAEADFIRAVASDERSYSLSLFQRAAGIAKKRSLKTADEIEKLRIFVLQVEETKATMEVEEDLGDVPDEYMDPISAVIMRDPVLLPSSKAIVDRKTIKQQLLSVPQDPFNRSALTIEDVIPDVELKAKIDAFLAERRSKNAKVGALDKANEDIFNVDESGDTEMAPPA